MNSEHINFMKRCLALAGEARANGKPGVGSVLVLDGQIIGEGVEGSPTLPAHLAHAEILAITEGISKLNSAKLAGCTLYTTVEPCVMCSYVIRNTGIGHVVIGTVTTGVGGVTSAYPILKAGDIQRWKTVPVITTGVMEDECRKAV